MVDPVLLTTQPNFGGRMAAHTLHTFPLVWMFDGEPVASTVAIAKHADVPHRSLYRLVLKHQERLARFGAVRFEIAERPSGTKGPQVAVCLLNEHQATMLLTMMRNSERVLDLKELLVSEFFRMRNEIERMRVTLYQERLVLAARAAASETKGSFGGLLMRERRTEKEALDAEEAALDLLMQPSLFGLN